MGSLLAQIAVFVVGAFGLGVGLGWLLWRAGRRSLPSSAWAGRERALARAAEQAEAAAAQADDARHDAERQRTEVERGRELLQLAWAERDAAARRLEAATQANHDLEARLQEALGRAVALQRRLAEWSIGAARAQGMPPGLQPARGDGAGRAARRTPAIGQIQGGWASSPDVTRPPDPEPTAGPVAERNHMPLGGAQGPAEPAEVGEALRRPAPPPPDARAAEETERPLPAGPPPGRLRPPTIVDVRSPTGHEPAEAEEAAGRDVELEPTATRLGARRGAG